MHRVFVYGTLKTGFPYHETGLGGQAFIGRCRTRVAFPLVIGGRWFSPILIAEPGVGKPVLGEVFAVDDQTLAYLDQLEGTHLPIGYERIEIAVEPAEGGVGFPAWTYVKERDRIEIIHSDFLEEYHLDPRYVPASRRSD